MVGFARALCDGVSNGYLSMVAVAEDKRGLGIGRELVQRLTGDDPDITWVLRAGARQRRILGEIRLYFFGDSDGKDAAKMTITLSPEIERALTEEAARRGTTPDKLAEQADPTGKVCAIPVGHVGPARKSELRAQVNAARWECLQPKELPPEVNSSKTKRRQEIALSAIP